MYCVVYVKNQYYREGGWVVSTHSMNLPRSYGRGDFLV